MAGNGFTKTQQAMVDILSDGMPHTREELHACCGPSSMSTIRFHLTYIRKKLPPGEDILLRILNRRRYYQWVRLLASAVNGRK